MLPKRWARIEAREQRERAKERCWYARMLINRDAPSDRHKVFRLWTEAVATYKATGKPKHVEMTKAMLAPDLASAPVARHAAN